MLGGADNPNGELPSYITGADNQPHYTYNINIPVRHNEPESIDNIRGALHYLAKEEQKDGLCAYGCSEVPERPAAGRPRKPHF
jgi:hypothetical protein